MGILTTIAKGFGFVPQNRNSGAGRVRSYAAAAVNRLTADFTIQNVSPDTDLFRDLRIMRARSRQLAKNDPYVVQFVRLMTKNIIGPAGLSLTVKAINNFTKDGLVVYDAHANGVIGDGFSEFSKKKNFTTAKTMTRPEFERLVIRTVAIDGECFIRRTRGFAGNRFRYALQLIPADCLDERLNTQLAGGNYIRLGVEKNQWDEPVAYHLRKANPVDFVSGNGTEYMVPTERVSADEVLHLFIQEAPQQSRGVPWMFSAISKLNHLGNYEESELVASRVSAGKLGFIITPDGQYQGDDTAADGSQIADMQPGDFSTLPFGSEIKNFDPQHPNSSFAEFHRAMMRGVAMAGGVAHASITGDLSQTTYSSARIGLLDERDTYKVLQSWFADHYADTVFADWLEMAMISGSINLPFSKFDKFNAPTWRGRRWGWVDPQKEAAANILLINNGLTSRRKVIEETSDGESFDDIAKELEEEAATMKAAGIFPVQVGQVSVAAEEPPAQPDTPKRGIRAWTD